MRGFGRCVISDLESYLYCMFLLSEADKLTKVICQDPWQPEVKMKGMKRDRVFPLRLQTLFQLYTL